MESQQDKYQFNLNPAHFGFIPGSGSTNGQLVVQEVITNAKKENKSPILIALDGQNSFNYINSTINQLKHFHHGFQDNNLLMIKKQNRDQSKVIKWDGRDSDAIKMEQGLSQLMMNY